MNSAPIYSYDHVLRDSLKVQWKVEDLIADGKTLDFSRPFLPESLAGTRGLSSLSEGEKRILNQIRGATYLHLFGLVEEFILPFAIDHARDGHEGDKTRTRALLAFAEEEAKHQQLFSRFSEEFRKGFATPLGLIGPAPEIAKKVLSHSPLAVAILVLHLEWLTQRHYLEAIKADEGLDRHFVDLLKHHWQEEAQHAKLDTLLVLELAARAQPEEIDAAIADFLGIGTFLDGGLQAQVDLDLVAFEEAIGRKLSERERHEITEAQRRSYRYTFLVTGLEEKNFVETIRGLSAAGLDQVRAAVAALS